MPEAARQPWHDFRTDSSGIVVYSNRMHITSNRSWFHAHELEAKQLPWHDVPNRFARDDYLYKCDAQLFRTMVDFTDVVRVQEASKVKVLSGFLRNLHWKMRTLTLCQMVPRWMQASLAFADSYMFWDLKSEKWRQLHGIIGYKKKTFFPNPLQAPDFRVLKPQKWRQFYTFTPSYTFGTLNSTTVTRFET